jgi:hypothetical protein
MTVAPAGPNIRGMQLFVCSLVLLAASGHAPERRESRIRASVPEARPEPEPQQEQEPEHEQVARVADEFFDSYLRWREACEDLRTAYDRWHTCEPPQRFLAFDGYRAALDREERAAHTHSDLAERLGASPA